MWLVWWDRIPQRKLLFQRQIIPHPMCPKCPNTHESTLHTLRDCNHASQIWNLINPPQTFWDAQNPKEWLDSIRKADFVFRGLPWNTLFPLVCFELWKERNKFVFEDKPYATPQILLNRAVTLAWEYNAYQAQPPV